jgi:hypothetical protein
MLAVGIAGSVPRTTASLWTLGGLLIVSPFFYNLGVGSVSRSRRGSSLMSKVYPVLAAEVPSTELRAQTSSIAFFAFAFGSFSFNLFFPCESHISTIQVRPQPDPANLRHVQHHGR